MWLLVLLGLPLPGREVVKGLSAAKGLLGFAITQVLAGVKVSNCAVNGF